MDGLDKFNEYFLFIENNRDIEDGNNSEATKLMDCIMDTQIWDILARKKFEVFELEKYFTSLSINERSNVFKFGISCFVHFVQANFTGPELKEDLIGMFHNLNTNNVDFTKVLALDDEEIGVDVNTKYPVLFFVSKCIFEKCLVDNIVNSLWSWRSLFIHQHILEDLSPTIQSKADDLKKKIDTFDLQGYTKAKFDLEFAQLYLLLRHINKSNELIDSAQIILGVKYTFGGRLGTRTVHQIKPLSQITLVDVELSTDNPDIKRPLVHDFEVPTNIPLKESVRLERTMFNPPIIEKEIDFPNTEQKLFLAKVQEMLISKPRSALQKELMLPFLDFILHQKNTWAVRTQTLLLRCRFEDSLHTFERMICQLEEIVDAYGRPKPHVLSRFADVFSTGLRPIWKVEAQYADALRNAGLRNDALNVYLRIQDWENVIYCYTLMELKHKAAEVIKEQLQKKETVKLLCHLGDTTDDITCYEKAWELSKERSYVAQRHWGNYFFARQNYEECIPHYQMSSSLHPIQPRVWMRLGYAALETKNWPLAASAYLKFTQLEPEGYEAWNNLAQAYIKMGRNKEAHNALAEALKYDYENWKIWENFLIVSCDISSHSNIIRAYHKILDLKKKYINIAALREIVFKGEKTSTDWKDQEGPEVLLKQTRELFGRITAIDSGNGYVWEMYSTLCPEGSLQAERLQKAFRAYTQLGWDKTPEDCVKVLDLCTKMAKLVLDNDLDIHLDLLNSVRLNLKSAVSTVSKHDWEETKPLIEEVSNYIQELLEKVRTKTQNRSS